MKAKLSIISFLAMVFMFCSDQFTNNAYSFSDVPPPARTGSPGDGSICAASGCHTGNSVTSQTGWITSNIGTNGYIPNTTYTITASATKAGNSMFGFEVSPQSINGTQLGTLGVINDSVEALVPGGDKYIGHTAYGRLGNGSKTWTFTWKAPDAGAGTVTFYGAFNCANGNGTSSGDFIYTSTLAVNENVTGIGQVSLDDGGVTIYPNPFVDELFFDRLPAGFENKQVFCFVYSCTGELIMTKELTQTHQSFNLLQSGIYYIVLKAEEVICMKKVCKV